MLLVYVLCIADDICQDLPKTPPSSPSSTLILSWIILCLLRLLGSAKEAGQCRHLNGLSPVCLRAWTWEIYYILLTFMVSGVFVAKQICVIYIIYYTMCNFICQSVLFLFTVYKLCLYIYAQYLCQCVYKLYCMVQASQISLYWIIKWYLLIRVGR